jgi:hypothetical protein
MLAAGDLTIPGQSHSIISVIRQCLHFVPDEGHLVFQPILSDQLSPGSDQLSERQGPFLRIIFHRLVEVQAEM